MKIQKYLIIITAFILLAVASTANAALLTSVNNGVTTQIGAQNAGWSHYSSNSPNGHYFGQTVTFGTNISSYTNDQLQITTPHGWLKVGPANGSWSHFETSAPKFYFGTNLAINGGVLESYGTDWISIRGNNGSSTGKLFIGSDDAQGNGATSSIPRLKIAPPHHTGGDWTFTARDNTPTAGAAYLDIHYLTTGDPTIAIKQHSGNSSVAIGTDDPGAYKLNVNGSIYSVSAEVHASDKRRKKNIKDLDINGLDIVNKLNPVSYEWKETLDKAMEGTHLGFIAQDVQKILPEIVSIQDNKEKTLGLKYSEFIPVLTKAIKEQQQEINSLKSEIEELKTLIKGMK